MTGNQDNDRRKVGWMWFTRGRRTKAAYDWADRLQWLFQYFVKTKSEMALIAGSTAVVGGVAGVTLFDAVEARRIAREQVQSVESVRSTENSTVFTIEGFDKASKRGLFDVVVAKKEFLWVKGSADELEKQGQVFKGQDIATAIFDGEVSAALASAKEIIAVGTASQEGDPAQEKDRAARRALATAALSKTAIATETPVWSLNLGQYRDQCAACETSGTSWQRPFIVVAVKSLEDGCNAGEALANAMTGKTTLPSPASYSAFEMTKVR